MTNGKPWQAECAHRASRVGLCLLAAWLVAMASGAQADSADEPDPQVVRYRRIFAPQDRLSEAIPKDDRYFSIDKEEFERLINLVKAGERGENLSPDRIHSAAYQARLEGDSLVAGSASLEIQHQGPASSLLPLAPCTLAIRAKSPSWHDPAQPQPAIVGSAAGQDALSVVVERSGSLRFAWSLRGERNTPDTLTFDLGLPKSPTKQLDLDLPSDQVLLASRGIVSKQGEPVAGRQLWRLELGGQDRVTLRVVSAVAANERRRLTLLRQSTSYDFSPHGVQLTSDWTIDVHHEPLSTITLRLEPTLRLVMARLAGTDIPWTATTDATTGVTSVVLQLAEPIEGVGRALQLKAVAPLETDAPWQLPRLNAEGMFWAEGKTRLLIPAPLSLIQLTPQDCRQTHVEEVATPIAGEIIELQHFSSAAAVEVLISRRAGRLQTQQGVTIDASANELRGQVVADFKIDEGERFSLSAQVFGDWIIDSVESVPSGALQDWNLEAVGQNSRRLTVELRKALTAASPRRLIVTGRWRRPVTEAPLPVADSRLVEFESNEVPRRLVLVRPARSLQLQTSGDSAFSRKDPTYLDGPSSALFDGRWQGVLFEISQAAPELSFHFETEQPRFSAETMVDVSLADRLLTETYHFHCVPESSRIEKLLVHFSEARDGPLLWTLDGEAAPHLVARRLHPDEAEIPDQVVGGETWEITLKRPLLSAFDLRAKRSRTFDNEVSLSLAALPDAVAQTGQVNLASTGASRLVLRSHRLKRIPSGQVTPTHAPEDRGSFTYEPDRDVFAPDGAAIVIAPAAKNARLPAAWVWKREIETSLGGAHGAAHVATFYLENLGRSATIIQVPEAATVQAVWLDETPVPQSVVDGFDQQFTVELPAGRRFPIVAVHYVTRTSTPWLVGTLQAAPPSIDLPVLTSSWKVWMPPGYVVAGGQRGSLPTFSWSQRLFGPLGQPTHATTAKSASSAAVSGAWRSSALRDHAEVLELLHALGAPLHHGKSSQAAFEAAGEVVHSISWGNLLREANLAVQNARHETENHSGDWELKIDEPALLMAGVVAGHVVPTSEYDAPAQRALLALQTAGLALVVQPEGVILTSADAAALQAEALTPLVGSSVFQLNSAHWNSAPAHASADQRLLAVEQWNNRLPPPERPWQTPHEIGDRAGWNAFEFAGSPLDYPPLTIVATQRMIATSTICFLLATGCVWWLMRARATWYLSALGSVCVLALVVPPAYVPIASGVVLGILLGGGFLLLTRQFAPRSRLEAPAAFWAWRGKTVVAGSFALCLLASSDWQLSLRAQTPGPAGLPENSPTPAADNAPRDPIFLVFIPTDENNLPVGSQYIISDRLRTLLQRRALAAAQLPPAWLLTDADYQLRLNQQGMPSRLSVSEIKSTWKFRTFQRNVLVELPLAQKEVLLAPGSARLNAKPTNPVWNSAGTALTLFIPLPGEYEFNAQLGVPQPAALASSAGLNWTIPKLATSRLTLKAPARIPEISLPMALGAIERKSQDGATVVQCELGPAQRLIVSWPSGEGSGSLPAQTQVEELHWLRIQPGAVELYVRFKVTVLQGRVGQLRLAADPRLRLLPMADDSSVAQVRVEAGSVQTLLLDLKRPVSDQVTVDARMLLTGASGVGNLRLPYAQLQGAQVKQRLLAISLDEGLAAGDPAGEALPSAPVIEFLGAWGPTTEVPQLVFRLPAQDIIWSLPIRPRESKTVATELLKVGVGRNQTRLDYEVELDTLAGFHFQHTLKVPSPLNVDEVRVVDEAGVSLLAHWSQPMAGQVTVFLNQAVAGKHRLRISGVMPTKLDGAWRMPQAQLQASVSKSGQLLLYRSADVLVDVNPGPKLKAGPRTETEYYSAEWGRNFASYTYENGVADALLSVSVNSPEISPSSALVTRLTRQKDQWHVELDYRLRVKNGLVDIIRFEIPTTWVGPFDAEVGLDLDALMDAPERNDRAPRPGSDTAGVALASNGQNSVEEIAPPDTEQVNLAILPGSTEGRLQLVITPQEAVGDSYRVRIRGPLQVPVGERVRVPEFKPRGVEQLDRYVMLPTVIGARRWNWEVRGLKVSAPPANLAPVAVIPHSPAPTFESFQVVADRFEAVSKVAGRTASVALVRLADISATISVDGAVAGVAAFHLEPAGLSECLLELPANFQPVQLRVAGLPSLSEPVGNGRWRVPLGPQQLPQRLEVLYSGKIPLSPVVREIAVPAPVLWQGRKPIRVERALWTVYNPVAWGQGQAIDGEPSTSLSQDLARMQSIATLLDSLESQTVVEHTLPQLELWFQSWATRLRKTHARIERQTTPEQARADGVRREANELYQSQERIATRLGVTETLARLQSQPMSLVEGNELWAWSQAELLPSTRASTTGAVDTAHIAFPSGVASDLPWRLAGAFLLAATFTGLVDFARRGWLQEFARRWSWPLCLLGGIAWSIWLTPSFVGWGIMLLCVLGAPRWPRRIAFSSAAH